MIRCVLRLRVADDISGDARGKAEEDRFLYRVGKRVCAARGAGSVRCGEFWAELAVVRMA